MICIPDLAALAERLLANANHHLKRRSILIACLKMDVLVLDTVKPCACMDKDACDLVALFTTLAAEHCAGPGECVEGVKVVLSALGLCHSGVFSGKLGVELIQGCCVMQVKSSPSVTTCEAAVVVTRYVREGRLKPNWTFVDADSDVMTLVARSRPPSRRGKSVDVPMVTNAGRPSNNRAAIEGDDVAVMEK